MSERISASMPPVPRQRVAGASVAAQRLIIQFGTIRTRFIMHSDISKRRASTQTRFVRLSSSTYQRSQPNFSLGKPLNQVISVAGTSLQYTAVQLANGVINVGRIHPVP